MGFFLFFTTSIEMTIATKSIMFIVSFIILSIGAVYLARRHYRERNIRLYVNYLIEKGTTNEEEKNEEEKHA